ncbi:hypothetical protein TRICI_006205 [Trichomonascus ciferrii]|uniref:Uncharacterized protein n=1 Tax=Trichomonascus ciferrii TaxID=44093 RepID=A0A642UJY2_9ASCO|nr:hypothetical protein TRICI_006205 [Trichomonascus ciferrii]
MEDPSEIDNYISAEIPDPNTDTQLFNMVTTHMTHVEGNRVLPLKSWLTTNSCCDINFSRTQPPFAYQLTCTIYASWDFNTSHACEGEKCYTNQNVASYNPLLLRLFDCHINVIPVTNDLVGKYCMKYLFKGAPNNSANFTYSSNDETGQQKEIPELINGRILSSNEAT